MVLLGYWQVVPIGCCWAVLPLPLIALFARFIRRRDPAAVRGWVAFLCLLWVGWVALEWWALFYRSR